MKKLLLLILSVLPSFLFGQMPALNWANSTDYTVNSTAVMPNGNIISGGYFSGINDFDPGADSLKITSVGNLDMCLQMLDDSGNLIWAKGFGSAEQDVITSIVTDVDGNIFVTGYFQQTVDFDLGPGVFNLTSAGYKDIFILKLTNTGDFVWVKQIGSLYSDIGNSIKMGLNGELLLTGEFSGTVDFGSTTISSTLGYLGSVSVSDIFVAKLSDSGNVLWVSNAGGTGSENGNDVTVDSQGNVYCTGDFQGLNIDFDPSAGQTLLSANPGDYDGFVMKLNANGAVQWAYSVGGSGRDRTSSIETDAFDKVYVSGQFNGSSDFDPLGNSTTISSTSNDVFIQKLNADGTLVWVKLISGAGGQACHDMFVSETGEAYIVGYASGDTDFDPSVNTQTITNATNNWYGYVTKLDANGNLDWFTVFEGTINFIKSINYDSNDNLILSGQQYGTIDVDPTGNVTNLNVAPFSTNSAMVIKYGSNSTTAVTTVAEQENVTLKIFPNPTQNIITIASAENIEVINIYNFLGQSVISNIKSSKIDLTALPDGIYFVKVKTSKNEYTHKIIKK